jgi:hypothetical protein
LPANFKSHTEIGPKDTPLSDLSSFATASNQATRLSAVWLLLNLHGPGHEHFGHRGRYRARA